jgi:hypothetical protein
MENYIVDNENIFNDFYWSYVQEYNVNEVVYWCFWLALFWYYEKDKGALKYKKELINLLIEDWKFIYNSEKLINKINNFNIEKTNVWEHVYRIWNNNNLEPKNVIEEIINEFTINWIINLKNKIKYTIENKVNFMDLYNSYLKYVPIKKHKNIWIHYFAWTFVFDWLRLIYNSKYLDINNLPVLSDIILRASKPVKSWFLWREYINEIDYTTIKEKTKDYIHSNQNSNIFDIENDLCDIGKDYLK